MLRFIRQCRALGFSMQQIQELLQLWTDHGRESRDVKELARRQLVELEQRQRELDAMRTTLSELVARCAGDEGAHCAILDRLAVATPAAVIPIRTTSLKQVPPGTRRQPRRSQSGQSSTAVSAPHPAHALMAWSHAAARPAATFA